MIAQKDPYIKSAYDQLQIISQNEQKRMEYEAREKSILDYNQGIYEAGQREEQRGERGACVHKEGTQPHAIMIPQTIHFSK